MKKGMHIESKPNLMFAMLVLGMIFAACGGPQARSQSDLGRVSGENYPMLVMAEPEFTFDHAPAEIYLRTFQLVQRLTEYEHIPVIAPWEVDVAEGERWPHGTAQLAALLESNGVGGPGVYVLRFRIEETGTMRTVDAPSSLGGVSATTWEPEVNVQLIVETLGGAELARVWYEYDEDVYADVVIDDGELRPMLRDAITLVATELGDQFEAAFEGGPRGSLAPLDAVYNARQVFTYGGGAGVPLNTQWQDLDPQTATVERFRWLRMFAPGLSLGQTEFFDSAAPGVLLTRAGGVVQDAGIRSGDYVVAVGDQPALGEHVLHRLFLSGQRGRSVPIDVLRDGVVRRIYVDLGRP